MKLYNIFYIDTTYGDKPSYECTTDNPTRWLLDHNKDRVADGNEPEYVDDFEVVETTLLIYNKESSNEVI